jgi:hypothetical protein
MPLPRLAAVVLGILTLVAACERSMPSPSPTPVPDVTSPADSNPASLPAQAAGASGVDRVPQSGTTAKGRAERMVNMLDACDPDTFNEAVGPGSCARSGGLRFDLFIEELTKLGFVGAWRFSPNTSTVRSGETFVAVNRGGEVHTFTEVATFGGGIVQTLNVLAHTPEVAPECVRLEDDDFVQPGGTYREAVQHTGTTKFQCCIHPWMRLEARVSQ